MRHGETIHHIPSDVVRSGEGIVLRDRHLLNGRTEVSGQYELALKELLLDMKIAPVWYEAITFDITKIHRIGVDKIEYGTWSPKDIDQAKLDALKRDFIAKGQLDPIIVKRVESAQTNADGRPSGKGRGQITNLAEGDRYEVVDGNYSLKAAKELGWKTVLAYVRKFSPQQEGKIKNTIRKLEQESDVAREEEFLRQLRAGGRHTYPPDIVTPFFVNGKQVLIELHSEDEFSISRAGSFRDLHGDRFYYILVTGYEISPRNHYEEVGMYGRYPDKVDELWRMPKIRMGKGAVPNPSDVALWKHHMREALKDFVNNRVDDASVKIESDGRSRIDINIEDFDKKAALIKVRRE